MLINACDTTERIEALVSEKTIACLITALALALTGCSGEAAGKGHAGPARTASPSPTETIPAVSLAEKCQNLSMGYGGEIFNEGLAMSEAPKKHMSNSELLAKLAAMRRQFANSLRLDALSAPPELTPALLKWASANSAVARHLEHEKPRPGIVVDWGAAGKRADKAAKAVGKICGHDLLDPGN